MGFGAYLKAYFKQCLEVVKHPKMLLPTVILAVVWIGLGILRMGEATKTYGGFASDAATPSGVDELGSFAQEVGFHTDSANALADEINYYRHKFFGI